MRLEGGGRKITNLDLEEAVLNWIHERRANMLRVSRKLIMRKAKAIHDESVGNDPVASRGWLEKFMKRNCLSLRRKTTTARKDPSHMIDKLVAYMLQIRRLSRQFNYDPSSIIAMDETAVWADMVSQNTVDITGTKDIPLKTTGNKKVRVSVCLTTKADGTKLKPFIVFGDAKRESKALNDEFKARCCVASSVNAWMNEELTIQFVNSVIGKFAFRRRLLAWDSFECHTTNEVRKTLKMAKVDSVVVPGGCTKYIQAPDVSWNKPFKGYLNDRYDEWLSNGVHEYTAGGNMKPPPRRKVVKWVLGSWDALSEDLIKKSFKSCGLNLKTDGSEDEIVYCFKSGSPCAAGLSLLNDQTAMLDDPSLQINPFEITVLNREEAAESFHLLDEDNDEDGFDVEL